MKKGGVVVFGITLILFVLSGCEYIQQKPTVMTESHIARDLWALRARSKAPLVLTPKTVVLDVRSVFEYRMFHIKGSRLVRWTDFYYKSNKGHYTLRPQRGDLARKLSYLGVDKKSRVLIVDKGLQGHGEAASLAWALVSLGVTDTQVSDVESFRIHFTSKKNLPIKNTSHWAPLNLLSQKKIQSKFNHEQKFYIIDVGSVKQYTGLVPQMSTGAKIIHIPWKDFVTRKGRLNRTILSQLRGIGISTKYRVVIKSPKGLLARATAYYLLSLGYKKIYFYDDIYQS